MRSPQFLVGFVLPNLIFNPVSGVLLFARLSFYCYSHGVVSLFSIYEFECPLVSFAPLLCRRIC